VECTYVLEVRNSKKNMAQYDFIQKVDLSRVDANDRGIVRDILLDILMFHHPMPAVKIDVYAVPGHYNCTISLWQSSLIDSEWYLKFLSPERDPKYDAIIETETTPVTDAGTGPIKLIRIRRSTSAKSSKRDKKK
jgi:hypothetical protein